MAGGGGGAGVWPGLRVLLKGSERPEAGCLGEYPPEVDRLWLWVYDNMIPQHPMFYLLKADYKSEDSANLQPNRRCPKTSTPNPKFETLTPKLQSLNLKP